MFYIEHRVRGSLSTRTETSRWLGLIQVLSKISFAKICDSHSIMIILLVTIWDNVDKNALLYESYLFLVSALENRWSGSQQACGHLAVAAGHTQLLNID